MLCLVAKSDDAGEYAVEIGRQIGSRLARAAKAKGWTQGEVHMHANAGQPEPIVSKATVSALLRGSIANPGIATVLPVAQALGITIDQLLGLLPMPSPTAGSEPNESLDARLDRLETTVQQFLQAQAQQNLDAAQAVEQDVKKGPRSRAAGRRTS